MRSNRYMQINPATFNPLSMQEMFFPADYMRTRHDAADTGFTDLNALDVNRLSPDDELVGNRLSQLRGQIEQVSNRLATSGIDRKIENELSSLRREYAKEMSPSGILGRAQQNYIEGQENWKAQRDTLLKQGAPTSFISKARDAYMSGYKGLMGEDGSFNEFTPGRTPGYYDIPNEARDYFSKVGIQEALTSNQSLGFTKDGNGFLILIDRSPSTKTDNINELNAALRALQTELYNTGTDKGYSAVMQGFSPDVLEELLVNTMHSFRRVGLNPMQANYQYAPTRSEGTGQSSAFTMPPPLIPTVTPRGNRPVTSGKSADKSRSYVVTTQESIDFESIPGNTPRDFSQTGRTYLFGASGASGVDSKQYRTERGLPKTGATMLNAVTRGYRNGFILDRIEDVPDEDTLPKESIEGFVAQRAQELIEESKRPKYGASMILNERDARRMAEKEFQYGNRLQASKKLKHTLDPITNVNNPEGGAILTVGSKTEKFASLPNLDKDFQPTLDPHTGEYYTIYRDGNGIVKVWLKPEFFRVDEGIAGNTKDPSKAKESDRLTAYTPVSREEAIRRAGIYSGASDPINVSFVKQPRDGDGVSTMVVHKDQPIFGNRQVSLINKANHVMSSLHSYYSGLAQGGNANDALDKLIAELSSHGVDPQTAIYHYSVLLNAKVPYNNQEFSIIELIGQMVQDDPSGERPNTRNSGSISVPEELQPSMRYFNNLLAALEAMELTQSNK